MWVIEFQFEVFTSFFYVRFFSILSIFAYFLDSYLFIDSLLTSSDVYLVDWFLTIY